MGQKFSYNCNNCGYSVLTSAGHDVGMLAVTDTLICKSCKRIVDVCVGVFGDTYSKEEIQVKGLQKEYEIGFYRCPECKSDKSLLLWNEKKRPCPQCDGKMIQDKDGVEYLWD